MSSTKWQISRSCANILILYCLLSITHFNELLINKIHVLIGLELDHYQVYVVGIIDQTAVRWRIDSVDRFDIKTLRQENISRLIILITFTMAYLVDQFKRGTQEEALQSLCSKSVWNTCKNALRDQTSESLFEAEVHLRSNYSITGHHPLQQNGCT